MHTLALTLLGSQVELGADQTRIRDLLAAMYRSTGFAPLACGRDEPQHFCCRTLDVAPWLFVIDLPGASFAGRRSTEAEDQFELHERGAEGDTLVGRYAHSGASADTSGDELLELIAIQFQRQVIDHLLAPTPQLRLVHGASLRWRDRGLLLPGTSGAGKTTLALACVMAGMQYLSDDYSLVNLEERTLAPFPRALKVRDGTLTLLPEVAAQSDFVIRDVRGANRHYLQPEQIRPDAVGRPVALTHLVELRPRGETARLHPCKLSEVLHCCMESDIFRGMGNTMERLWAWGQTLANVRVGALEPAGLHETVAVLKAFMEEADGADGG